MPSIMRNINVIGRCYAMFRTEKQSDEELKASYHSYIYAIYLHQGMTQEQLAGHLCLNKSTVARGVAHLEALGYVERRPSESDKRVFLLYPTPKMTEIFPQVRSITKEWNRWITQELTEDELNSFCEILEKLSARAREITGNKEDKNPQ